MIAECVKSFRDLKANTTRNVGDRFEVTAERLKDINATKYGKLAKAVDVGMKAETSPESDKKAERGRKATRKSTR